MGCGLGSLSIGDDSPPVELPAFSADTPATFGVKLGPITNEAATRSADSLDLAVVRRVVHPDCDVGGGVVSNDLLEFPDLVEKVVENSLGLLFLHGGPLGRGIT